MWEMIHHPLCLLRSAIGTVYESVGCCLWWGGKLQPGQAGQSDVLIRRSLKHLNNTHSQPHQSYNFSHSHYTVVLVLKLINQLGNISTVGVRSVPSLFCETICRGQHRAVQCTGGRQLGEAGEKNHDNTGPGATHSHTQLSSQGIILSSPLLCCVLINYFI